LVDSSETLAAENKFFLSGHGTGSRKQAEDATETVLAQLSEIEKKFIALLQT
jgi:hypothetical protein